MDDFEGRLVEIDGQTALLRIHIGLTGGKEYTCRKFRVAELQRIGIIQPNMLSSPIAQDLVFLGLKSCSELKAVLRLPFESRLLTIIEHHSLYLCPAQGHQEVILVGR